MIDVKRAMDLAVEVAKEVAVCTFSRRRICGARLITEEVWDVQYQRGEKTSTASFMEREEITDEELRSRFELALWQVKGNHLV